MRKVSQEICNHAKEVPHKSKDRCAYIYIYNEKIYIYNEKMKIFLGR